MNPKIHLLGFSNNTGYGIHTNEIVYHLRKIKPIIFTNLCNQDETIFHQNLYKNDDNMIHICISYGNMCQDILGLYSGIKICYTVWESTVIPIDWKDQLNSMDRIWIPSQWGKDIMIKNGMNELKIDVVPEGVNHKIFHPIITKPFKMVAPDLPGFRFLHIGKFETRKATKEVILAFDEEFRNDQQVYLFIQSHNQFIKNFNIFKTILELGIHPNIKERIIIVDPIEKHYSLARLYQSCDCFVYPTRAEGWGLPLIEAMSSGLPCITTNHGGQSQFLPTTDDYYYLPYQLKSLTKTDFGPYSFKTKDQNYGQWADFERSSLRQLMRKAYKENKSSKEIGKKAAKHIHNNFTWDHSAQRIIDIVNNL